MLLLLVEKVGFRNVVNHNRSTGIFRPRKNKSLLLCDCFSARLTLRNATPLPKKGTAGRGVTGVPQDLLPSTTLLLKLAAFARHVERTKKCTFERRFGIRKVPPSPYYTRHFNPRRKIRIYILIVPRQDNLKIDAVLLGGLRMCSVGRY